MSFFVCLCLYLADYVFLCKFNGTIDGSEKEIVEEDREGCVLYGNIVFTLLIEKISRDSYDVLSCRVPMAMFYHCVSLSFNIDTI